MILSDLRIDFNAAASFIKKWNQTKLDVNDFSEMLEESASWHNIPVSVLKTVAFFECGYPSTKVYDSSLRRRGSVFVGPFQEGSVYLAGVNENKDTVYYRWLTLAPKTEQLSLGAQLYLMVAEKVRLAHMRWAEVGSIGHAPLNAGVIYSLHVRPLKAFRYYASRKNFDSRLPSEIYAGQSSAVTSYFSRVNVSAMDIVQKAQYSGYF